MPSLPTTAIPRRVALALAAGVLLCVVAFALAVGAVRDRVDARAASDSVRLVAARLGDLREALATVTNDYNHWTDAYLAMERRDLPWIAENYAITAISGTMFDGLVLFDGPLDAPVAWVEGSPAEPGPSFLPPVLLDRVRAEVGRLPLGPRTTWDAMVAVDGRLMLLSASRVQPLDPAEAAGLDPEALAIAVVTNGFDAEDAGAIVEAMSLPGIAFVAAPAPNEASLPIRGPDGEVLGVLAWSPPRPGSAVTGAMAPVLGLAALAFLVLGAVAAWLARALVRRLVLGEAEARRLARTDSMTGLPNRLAFNEAIAAPARAGARAVLFLDLNGFKRINDTIGHDVGDLVIREMAGRLGTMAAAGCFLARIGGDEFVFVVSGEDCAARTAAVAAAIKATMELPFEVRGHRLPLKAAVGYAVQAADGVPGEDLMRQADLAMYAAKREGADAVAFSDVIERAAGDALTVEQALRAALAEPPGPGGREGEIQVAYQPIVEAGTRRLVRAEALARWTSPVLGVVAPDRFIPVAEQAGLITLLGRRIFLLVCDDLARHPGLRVSLNVSPLQLMAPSFVADMADELARRGIAPSRVEVELTEGVVVDDPGLAARRLQELHAAGFSTALDDFGTGYSSIGYLDQMTFDEVKIDRSFVSGFRVSGERVALVNAMILLGHAMGLRVVCEGVETAAELDALDALGCDLLQGFHLDRPLTIDQLAARWLRAPGEEAVA